MTSKAISDLFPGWDRQQLPPDVEAELDPGEELLWLGGPDRWGLFRATPFVVVLFLVVGISTYISAGSGLTLWEYAARLLGTMGLAPHLAGLGLVGLFAVFLGLSLRDPRPRWNYVVTDRRLLTFYRGEKLREANIGRMNRLRVLQGIEGRLRNVGDVLWSPVTNVESNSGPDRGRHGFRGIRDPKIWQQRLQTWGQTVELSAATDARSRPNRQPTCYQPSTRFLNRSDLLD